MSRCRRLRVEPHLVHESCDRVGRAAPEHASTHRQGGDDGAFSDRAPDVAQRSDRKTPRERLSALPPQLVAVRESPHLSASGHSPGCGRIETAAFAGYWGSRRTATAMTVHFQVDRATWHSWSWNASA